MYGAYVEALMRGAAKKVNPAPVTGPRWFTCLNCDVMWKVDESRSHCFACGRWGKRGEHARG